MKRHFFSFLIAILCTACASAPAENDDRAAFDRFGAQLAEASEHERGERRLSYLEGLPPPDLNDPALRWRAERERTLALALESLGSAAFPQHGGAFYRVVRDLPVHLTTDREQALACLGGLANGGDCSGLLPEVAERGAAACGSRQEWPADTEKALQAHLGELSARACRAALLGDRELAEKAFVQSVYWAKRLQLLHPMRACAMDGDILEDVARCALDRVASGQNEGMVGGAGNRTQPPLRSAGGIHLGPVTLPSDFKGVYGLDIREIPSGEGEGMVSSAGDRTQHQRMAGHLGTHEETRTCQ